MYRSLTFLCVFFSVVFLCSFILKRLFVPIEGSIAVLRLLEVHMYVRYLEMIDGPLVEENVFLCPVSSIQKQNKEIMKSPQQMVLKIKLCPGAFMGGQNIDTTFCVGRTFSMQLHAFLEGKVGCLYRVPQKFFLSSTFLAHLKLGALRV